MSTRKNITEPYHNELPSQYAERLGLVYLSSITKDHKKKASQYFTPVAISKFMSELYNNTATTLNILDPGAGSGVLSCSICEYLTRHNMALCIYLTLYENDLGLLPFLEESLKYLSLWLKSRNSTISYTIIDQDFILANADALRNVSSQSNNNSNHCMYDLIISNPPYFKISKSDPRAIVAESVVHGQPNTYALFMAVSAALLKPNGELIYITPRSFTAGPYFRLFRQWFFSRIRPKQIHIFKSRMDAFSKDAVLQENIIMKAIRDDNWVKRQNEHYAVISLSTGVKDLANRSKRNVPLVDIIDLKSHNKVLCFPTTDEEEEVIQTVNSWTGNLHAYGIEVLTGPVVPFRATELIDEKGEVPGTHVPLLWMQNVKSMCVQWPIPNNKPQFIKCNISMKHLVKNKNYVLLRRFSPKEGHRRLIASPYLPAAINGNFQYIGLENHLNYFDKIVGELSNYEAYGLAALLNCSVLDTYFRTFNGNTEVSATELRCMPFPPIKIIKKIGKFTLSHKLQNGELDEWVTKLLMGKNSDICYIK